ncbi:hypothetical protein FHS83_002222 [Rhizomicrobium palustre]|uniref:Uncharacterized protein n=1 Tax=Rhizomicrobium palustre TaxID=189966 RepID=A0A846MZ27_9PROT|nr:hypothetical protein [Rhizomicrobium palustre]
MIGQTLSMIFPAALAAPSLGAQSQADHGETVFTYLQRVRDELLWPRILVRSAPPPDEI